MAVELLHASHTLRVFFPEILLVQMDAVRENAHTLIQFYRLFEEQRRHPFLQLIQPSIQIRLHRGWQEQTGVVGTEIVQIEVDGVLDKSGETAAAAS